MRTKISGDITIENAYPNVVSWITENLTFTNPVYANLKWRGQEETIQRRHVSPQIKAYACKNGTYIVPFGCLPALWPMIKEGEWSLDFAPDHVTAFAKKPCAVTLMDYQERAVSVLLQAKGGVLKAGCGSGKTYMGIELLRRIGKRFLWLCGKSDLLNQTLGNFRKLYPDLDIGTITDGEVNMGKDGTISTVQTLINVDYRLYQDEFNAVVLDECHYLHSNPATRQMYAKVLARCKARYKYGLTATPSRKDGLVGTMYAYLGMSPRGTFRPTVEVKDSETQSLVSEYDTMDLDTPRSYAYLMEDGTIDFNALLDYLQNDAKRSAAIADGVAKYVSEGRKVALLSYRVDHVYVLESLLKERGVKCGSVTGKTTKKQRKATLECPDEWSVIISTVHLFKEGLDIRALDTVVIALPFKDSIGIQQSEGRAERPMEGKKPPLFVFCYDKNIPYCQKAEEKMRRVVKRKRR